MLLDVYLRRVESLVEQEKKKSSNKGVNQLMVYQTASERLELAKKFVGDVSSLVSQVLSLVEMVSLSTTGSVNGGEDGHFTSLVENLVVRGSLPVFTFTRPSLANRLPAFTVHTDVNHHGEYLFKLTIYDPENITVSYEYQAVVVDAKVQLFLPGCAGTVEANVRNMRVSGPLHPLIYIDRFISLEEDKEAMARAIAGSAAVSPRHSADPSKSNGDQGIDNSQVIHSSSLPLMVRSRSDSAAEKERMCATPTPPVPNHPTSLSGHSGDVPAALPRSISLESDGISERNQLFMPIRDNTTDDLTANSMAPSLSRAGSNQSTHCGVGPLPTVVVSPPDDDDFVSQTSIPPLAINSIHHPPPPVPQPHHHLSSALDNPPNRRHFRGLSTGDAPTIRSASSIVTEYLTEDQHELKVAYNLCVALRNSQSAKGNVKKDSSTVVPKPPRVGIRVEKFLHGEKPDSKLVLYSPSEDGDSDDDESEEETEENGNAAKKKGKPTSKLLLDVSAKDSNQLVDVSLRTDLQGILHDIMDILSA